MGRHWFLRNWFQCFAVQVIHLNCSGDIFSLLAQTVIALQSHSNSLPAVRPAAKLAGWNMEHPSFQLFFCVYWNF